MSELGVSFTTLREQRPYPKFGMSGSGIYGPSTTNALVNPALQHLADDAPRLMDAVVLDFLLIEMVPILKQSTTASLKKIREAENEMIEAGLLSPPAPTHPIPPGLKGAALQEAIDDQRRIQIEEEDNEALRLRLESIGVSVGGTLAERSVRWIWCRSALSRLRLSKDKARFQDTLDTIKFICKDLWMAVWDKQVDNLRTNHRV